MALPIVAIVGRPNVGKSSLLNSLARQMISIVDPTAGVTRDRVSAVIEIEERFFELIDTGGYGIEDHDNLTEHVEGQIAIAIETADLVIFVVDVKEGISPLDKKVAQLLRKKNVQVLLVANKCDSSKWESQGGEFYKLGFGHPLCVSATEGYNRKGLIQAILDLLAHMHADSPAKATMKLAVVGKRNVGKSTFINRLAGSNRVIVSEVPGTTRDAVDVKFEKDGHTFIAIDTAGLRKKARMSQDSIEFYSYTRATKSVKRADVVLLLLDATAEISQVDKKLGSFIAEQFKPCIIVFNKWDLVMDRAGTEQYAEYVEKLLPGLSYAPISFITAEQGKNVNRLVELANQLHNQASTSVPTAKLNKVLEKITSERAPSVRRKVGLPKIFYGTQVATKPPTLLLFANKISAIDENYQRFLINRLREILPFSEVPIRILIRDRHSGDKKDNKK